MSIPGSSSRPSTSMTVRAGGCPHTGVPVQRRPKQAAADEQIALRTRRGVIGHDKGVPGTRVRYFADEKIGARLAPVMAFLAARETGSRERFQIVEELLPSRDRRRQF